VSERTSSDDTVGSLERDADNGATIADVIRAVSDELIQSRTERIRSGRPPVFEVSSLDIELSFIVTTTKKGGGGVDLKVLRGEVSKSYEETKKSRRLPFT
jgi:hypothetical protein